MICVIERRERPSAHLSADICTELGLIDVLHGVDAMRTTNFHRVEQRLTFTGIIAREANDASDRLE